MDVVNKFKLRLFHLSEKGDIDTFIPRPSKKMWGYHKYVWAIAENKIHNYLFPRACPRICIREENIAILNDWIPNDSLKEKKAIIFVPKNWEERIRTSLLFQYEFDPMHFIQIDKIAGYYVSKVSESPINLIKIDNCLGRLATKKIEVVFVNNQELREIRKEVIQTMKSFSIIKWDNLKAKN